MQMLIKEIRPILCSEEQRPRKDLGRYMSIFIYMKKTFKAIREG